MAKQFELYWFDYINEDGTKKSRPILILESNILLPIAEITSHEKRTNKDYEIIKWKEAGLSKKSVIRFDKIQFATDNLLKSKIGELQQEDIDKIKELKLVESLKENLNDFWNIRDNLEELSKKFNEVNLIIDNGELRPLSKEELANKFAVSIEQESEQDYKTPEELKRFAQETGAEHIMFFIYDGQYGGEYSFLYSGDNLEEVEDKVYNIAKKYNQKAYAMYDDKGNYHEILV